MSLTNAQCNAANPKDKPYKLSDKEGLYLRITPNGQKYWRLKYRINGKEKLCALGTYPKVTLLQARQEKDRIKAGLKDGIDPIQEKAEKRALSSIQSGSTFENVAREWHSKGTDSWDPRYAKTLMHRLEKYTFGDLGKYPIHQLRPIIILSCLQKIELTAPEMARRVKQIVSHVFKYAIATGKVEHDSTYGLEAALKKYKKGHFASIEVDELPNLLAALHSNKARLYRQTFLAINLMLLTFVRTSELIEARWSEIDFKNSIWTIPPERMKMRTPHLVPLSTQSLAIFEELKKMNEHSDFVFPSIPRPRKPMSKGTILVALKRMGYSNRMTGHGFRSLALGILKEKLGYTHEIPDRQLAHAPRSSTDRAYDRAKFLPQRTAMMQQFADYLDTLY